MTSGMGLYFGEDDAAVYIIAGIFKVSCQRRAMRDKRRG
jgi:hypothetical protein